MEESRTMNSGKTFTVRTGPTREEAVKEQERLFPRQTWHLEGTDGTAEKPHVSRCVAITLPEICLNLRASITGASDPHPNRFLLECREMLACRILTWIKSESAIDNAVFTMCIATEILIKSELESRDARGTYYPTDEEREEAAKRGFTRIK